MDVDTYVETTGPNSNGAQPEVELPERKIAIVGYTSSREDTPFNDPTWEFWGMNNLHLFMDPGRFARWYNLHTPDEITVDKEHVDWLRGWQKYPVYIMDPLDGVTDPDGAPPPSLAERTGWPQATPFPRANVEHLFGTYFTNTVSWQIAHALYEGLNATDYNLTTIGLWGVDMAVGTEYAAQRPSVEYFLGLARGMGVEIVIPNTSDLLKTAGLYGVEDKSGFGAKVKVRLNELLGRKGELEEQINQLQAAHSATCGAIDSFRYIEAVWLPPSAGRTNRDAVHDPAALSAIGDVLLQSDYAERHKG